MPNLEQCLSHAEAMTALDAVRREAERRGMTAVVAVADAHGEIMAILRMDGAPLASLNIAANKAWTASRLRRPTRVVGERLKKHKQDVSVFADSRFVAKPGGLPIYSGSAWLGSVAVSGASSAGQQALQTDDDDEALAQAAITLLSKPYPPTVWNEFGAEAEPLLAMEQG